MNFTNGPKWLTDSSRRNTRSWHKINKSDAFSLSLSRASNTQNPAARLSHSTGAQRTTEFHLSIWAWNLQQLCPLKQFTTRTQTHTHTLKLPERNSCTLMNALYSFHRKLVHLSPLMQPFHFTLLQHIHQLHFSFSDYTPSWSLRQMLLWCIFPGAKTTISTLLLLHFSTSSHCPLPAWH